MARKTNCALTWIKTISLLNFYCYLHNNSRLYFSPVLTGSRFVVGNLENQRIQVLIKVNEIGAVSLFVNNGGMIGQAIDETNFICVQDVDFL